MVESGGNLHPRDGDNGRSIGPYQISRPYWQDSKVGGSYQRCREKDYSERVMKEYWKRHAPQTYRKVISGRGNIRDFEKLARIHNGGPRGHMKPQTTKYWKKVHAQMRR